MDSHPPLRWAFQIGDWDLVETAKLNGLDPEAYLADVIDRMAKGHPINRLAELLSCGWKAEPAELAA